MLPSTLLLFLALGITTSTHAIQISARNPLHIPAFPRSPKPEAQPGPPLAPAPRPPPAPAPAPRPPSAPAPAPRPPSAPAPRPPPATKPDRKPDDPEVPDAPDAPDAPGDSGASSRRLNGPSKPTGSNTVRFLRGTATVGSSTRTIGAVRTADVVSNAGAGTWLDERAVIVISVVVVAFA